MGGARRLAAARKAVEYALVSYDFGEAFTALNLVLGPTLDDVLLTQLGRAAKGRGDDLTWLLTSFLAEDSRRRGRWSRALADLAVAQRPDNRDVLAKWVGRWAARADEAALGLGTLLEAAAGVPAAQVAAHARSARRTVPRRTARDRRRQRRGASRLTMETARWRDTINLDDLWEGDMAAVTVDGETVLLVNVGRYRPGLLQPVPAPGIGPGRG